VPNLTPTPTFSDSTVPANGDVNPYGVSFVPIGFPSGGPLRPGDVVVSNFNNAGNLQGTGTTIVRVNANASPTLFYQSPLPGLSTALGVLSRGYVLVGNVPSTDGSGSCAGQQANVGQGAIQVIDRNGKLVQTLTNAALLDGPWDLTVEDQGGFALIFVSNVLTGTVTRLDVLVSDEGGPGGPLKITSATQIASGYAHACNSASFVVGPTGLALDPRTDTLYIASTADNAIYAVRNASLTASDAGKGRVVVNDPTHLHGPLGLALAPNGDLVAAEGDAINPDPAHFSEISEFTPDGAFVAEFQIDPAPGSAFGLAVEPGPDGFRFAAVDDGVNALDVWVVH
jgi:hypothetical protein